MKLFLIILFSAFLYAAEDTKLTCEAVEQQTTENSLWKCPDLDNKTYSTLTDINLYSGDYTCSYNYRSTGRFATSCTYRSSKYLELTKEKFSTIDTKLLIPESVDFEADAKILSSITGAPSAIANLQTLTNDLLNDLKTAKNNAIANKADGISVDSEIASMQQLVYDHLQKPYLSPHSDIKKGDTLSRFLVGLMTLDPEVVKGYDERTGQLMITPEWESKAAAISSSEQTLINKILQYLPWVDSDPLVGLGSIMKNKALEGNDLDNDTYNIASWLDIFKMKIWGYFYNLNRKLDIAYDKISTTLVFYFLIFAAAGIAISKGTKFALRRRKDPELGENFSLDEKGTIRLLTIVAAFLVFFVSVPSGISSNNVTTDSTEIPNEFKMNNSIFKSYIRFVAREGTYFADMMTDFGTAAYLDYMIKRQGLYTGEDIRSLFASSVRQMVYYYPSLQLAQECEMYYGQDFNAFISNAKDAAKISVQPKYNETAPFFLNNNIRGISWELCKNVHQNLILVPSNISKTAAETESKLENTSKVRAEATRYIVQNHVLLQHKLGWVNVISIPFTHLLMSRMDLFFESGLDYRKIDNKMKEYISNVGIKDGGDIESSSNGWFSLWGSTTSGKIRNSVAKDLASDLETITHFALYYFLPGFKGIKTSLEGMKPDLLRNKLPKIPFLNIVAYASVEVLVFFAAITVWHQAFFIITFAILILLITFRMIFKLLMLTMILVLTPFLILWAFTLGKDAGLSKFKQFTGETLWAAFSIILLVLSAFLIPFFMDALNTLTAVVTSSLIEQQMHLVNLAITGNNQLKQDAFISYFTLYSVKDTIELLIPLTALWFAWFLVFRLEKIVKRLIGVRNDAISDDDLDDPSRQTQGRFPNN